MSGELYRDPSASIAERVEDLLSRMTLEEKAMQLCGNLPANVLDDGKVNQEKLKELFDHKTLYGIQGAYYYKTMFGPLGATFGYSNRTKKPYFFLDLGYEF